MTRPDVRLPSGYRFSGVHCGLRPDPDRRDLALIVSDRPASAAGVFTQNRICAAPVHVCRERLPRNDARGVVICSGNANACTGEQGMRDARAMTDLLARELGCAAEQVLVCSTGVIGRLLPMNVFETGVPKAFGKLTSERSGFDDAAHAILTTDTRVKTTSHPLATGTLTGFAKGAAMIGPNMATMLGFLMTDARVEPGDLHAVLKGSVEKSFNCVSVEGHTSTNDTVLILANGEGEPLKGAALAKFSNAVHQT